MDPDRDAPALIEANSWARTVAGLRDASLQVGWVRDRLQRTGTGRAADVLSIVLARAEQHEERYGVLLLRVSLALTERAALRSAIARVAEARGQLALARFLGGRERLEAAVDGAPLEAAVDGAPLEAASEAEARELPDFGAGRPLALGERKSLARTRDRALLSRALRDPHPEVIRILLDNPNMREADVVRICARRPVQASVLDQVFRHHRWMTHYRIRLALVLNPYTPDELALQLLPHLTQADRRRVAASQQLSERLRQACIAPTDQPLH